MIHVAIAIHDPKGEYTCHAGAMLASLFSHTPAPVSAYVLHDSTLTVNNKANLRSIAQRFGKELRFHQVVLPPEVHALGGHVTQGALYRLLLPQEFLNGFLFLMLIQQSRNIPLAIEHGK